MKNLKLFILATLTLFLVSCGNLSLNQQNTVKEGYTQLSIGMYRSNSRTLSPASEIDLSDFAWTISFESDLISVKDEEITEGLSTTVTLPNGIYKISAKSKTDTADFAGLIFSGSKEVSLEGNTQSISIPVSLTKTTDGTGTIFADTLTFPEIVIQEAQTGTSSGTIIMDYYATLVSVKDTLKFFPLELTKSEGNSQIYKLDSQTISSGYYYLELYCDVNIPLTSSDGSISAGVETLKTIKLDTPDTLVEIADGVETDISGISISENSSNKTYYATVGESKYNGVWASYPANLNTLLKKLTSTTDWYYATIYITDTRESTDDSLNITINADSISTYENVDTSKIELYLQLRDGSVEEVGTIQKSPYSKYDDKGIFSLSGEEIGYYNYEFLPGQNTSDVLINASGYIYRSVILHDGISFICPFEYSPYLNLTLDPADDFDPTQYNPTNNLALIRFDYMTVGIDTSDFNSDSINYISDEYDGGYIYAPYLNNDKTKLYLLPAIPEGTSISVEEAIPDFSINVGYDSTKTYSTGQPFYIQAADLNLYATADNNKSFETGTTFTWLINNYAIEGDSINLTTATNALNSSSNTLQCIAFYEGSIKSQVFTLIAVEPVNSDILYYKLGDDGLFHYSFESAEKIWDSGINYANIDSVAIYKNNYLIYCYDDVLRSTFNPDISFVRGISVDKLNYYALTDSLYFTNSSTDSKYNFYRIKGISDKSNLSTDDIIPYYSLDLSNGINAPAQIKFTDDYVVSITNNDTAGTNLPTKYTCNIYENNLEAETEQCKIVSTITLDFSSLKTKNLTIKDLIINEKHNAAFVLIKDYDTDYTGANTDAFLYSHGGLLRIPLDTENNSTINVTKDNLIGWDETVATYPYTYTDSNDVEHTITLTVTGSTDQGSKKFIAPQKFVAIRDDKLIIGDNGYYFTSDDTGISSSHKARVFVYDLNEDTLDVLEDLSEIQNETYEEDEANFGTGWIN